MFTIDGLQWSVPCKIERVVTVKASEISGMLLNKNYFNDVIGTFLAYTVSLALPFGKEAEYEQLHNILSEPVDAHTVTLPYNNTTVTINGKIDQINDTYLHRKNRSNYWMEIGFTITANSPTKTHTLGEAISRGISPMPDIAGAQEGDLYIFHNGIWETASYTDVDNKAY